MFSRNLRTRLFIVFVLTMLLAVAGYAFAATNTVHAGYAGDGSAPASGYDITVKYEYDAGGDYSKLSKIDLAFTTAGPTASGDVHLSLDGGTTWIACSYVDATTWSCATTATVLSVGSVRVVAIDPKGP